MEQRLTAAEEEWLASVGHAIEECLRITGGIDVLRLITSSAEVFQTSHAQILVCLFALEDSGAIVREGLTYRIKPRTPAKVSDLIGDRP